MATQTEMQRTVQKHRNIGTVLRYVATGEETTRIGIARRINLTKMAISNMVNTLIADGYLLEHEDVERGYVGRKPMLLRIAPEAGKVLSLFLSRRRVTALLCSIQGEILSQTSAELEEETSASLTEKIYALLDAVCAEKRKHDPASTLLGVGVATIGPVSAENGELLNPPDFFGISRFPLGQRIAERYGRPVIVNNDMNASALAENLFGVGLQFPNFLYLGLTHGIGLGIVSGGELYQKGSSFVGEIGHMTIDCHGARCTCGNRGCLETYANLSVILERLSAASGERELCAADFSRLYAQPACRAVLDEVMRALAAALTNAVNLLDPQCIVVGAEGAYLPDACLALLEREINQHILAVGYRRVVVVRSTFAADAALIGSACCVLDRVFSGEVRVLAE